MATSYPFHFDPSYTGVLRLLGVHPDRAHVAVGESVLEARFGPWLVRTPLTNVKDASITGPHRPIRAIGPRYSPTTRSLTFGSNADRTVRIAFDEPVAGLDPFGILHHPSLSVSVADPEGLRDELRQATSPG